MSAKAKSVFIKSGAAVFWLVVWQLISMAVGLELLLPSPVSVIKRLSELAVKPDFWSICLSSLGHVTLGFLAALVLGVVLGALMHISHFFSELMSPLLKIIKSTPVASFIILALVWLNSRLIPSFISFLMVLPIVTSNLTYGLKETDKGLLEAAKIFRFSKMRKVTELYIPSLMPYLSAACTTGIGLAWKAGIAAEVIAVTANSIGLQLNNSKKYLETVDLFAWTAALILLSALMEFILNRISSAVNKRFGRETGGEAQL